MSVCYLHAGTHKTATTTIQTVLTARSEALDAHAVHVPRTGRPWPHSGHHNIAWELNGDPRFDPAYGTLDDLVAEIAGRQASTVCLSSEDFEYLHKRPVALERLRDGLGLIGYEMKIVLYLRPQAEYAQSLYVELLKHGLRRSFRSFLGDILQFGSITFSDDWVFCFEYERLLDAFARVFGRERVLVRRYERCKPSSFIIQDFFETVNVSPSAAGPLEPFAPSNVTPSLEDIVHVDPPSRKLESSGAFEPLNLLDALRLVRRFGRSRDRVARDYGLAVPVLGPQWRRGIVQRASKAALRLAEGLPAVGRSSDMGNRRALDVGHADDAELLIRNLRHHLAIGIAYIVVSTIGEDVEAAEIVARCDPKRVFHRVVNSDREDPFVYFASAARWVVQNLPVNWIGFVDTDEFIVTRMGRLECPSTLERCDMLVMRRYNAALERNQDGTVAAPKLDDLDQVAIVDAHAYTESAWAKGDMAVPSLDAVDVDPKLFVRPHLIVGILSGGHTIVTRASYVVRVVDPTCAIVHVPLTTLPRFERKVAAIRQTLTEYGHRFDPWRWRHWASLPDDALGAEFQREALGSDLSGRPNTTTPRAMIARQGNGAHDWRLLSRAVAYDGSTPPERRAGDDVVKRVLDNVSYLSRYPDLAAAARGDPTFDSAEHFGTYGIVEGRVPSYAFDTELLQRYLEQRFGGQVQAREVWWLFFAQPEEERIVPNFWFDAAWFRARHGDDPSRQASDWVVFASYLSRVADEALSPNAWFDEDAYRKAFPALAAAIARRKLTSGFQHFYLRAHFGPNLWRS